MNSKLKTAFLLGPFNIFRVVLYRIQIKLGWYAWRNKKISIPKGPFFNEVKKHCSLPFSENWCDDALYFGWRPVRVADEPPLWHQNPFDQTSFNATQPWWKINEFESGDIKLVWEASRFSWVVTFCQRALTGQTRAWTRLNDWLTDWCEKNPPCSGVNWKCGQEAAIRVMNLAMAAVLLEQTKQPTPGLLELVYCHLTRIATTAHYAISQDNNHGTSEAAALFIGGSWLGQQGIPVGIRWAKKGRRNLENRVSRLIGSDGHFSQYSVNYHRVLLDTLAIVEIWRRTLDLAPFSSRFQLRALAATHWLAAITDAKTGDAPNIGANDGAQLLQLTAADYRDFRASVQLAMVLFAGHRAYFDTGPWDLSLAWLGIKLPKDVISPPGNQVFDKGGFAVLRCLDAMAVLRYPRFRFRPSQADVMHVDLWHAGNNLLRDAGTYSYHTDSVWLNYFPGTASHNTIQFDEREQMPRLSRFLFGDWLKTKTIEYIKELEGGVSFAVSYQDHLGAYHRRQLLLTSRTLKVVDDISGFTKKAVLRWRLSNEQWFISGTTVTNGRHSMSIKASMPIDKITVVTGWESRYYMQKTEVPVLEVEVSQAGTLFSEYQWML